jgi:hypothetical protein
MDTTKLRATAQYFLQEMNSSEELLEKMQPFEDKELATTLINSSKEMAISLVLLLTSLISKMLLSTSPWLKLRN